MLRNYFKIALRSLWKHKAYSLINVAGLGIGLTACLIVATVVFDELSYDHQWKKADDLYRVLMASNSNKAGYMPIAYSGFTPALKRELPEVEDACRLNVTQERLQLTSEREGVTFKNLAATPSIWNMLDFEVTQGNPHNYVKGYTNLVITEKISKQYFPNQDAVGKVVTALSEYDAPGHYLITGVIKDIPQNSHLRADIITVSEYRPMDTDVPKKGHGYSGFAQYVLLKHSTDINAFTTKVNKWNASYPNSSVTGFSFRFQSIKDVYLKSDNTMYQEVHSSIRNVYIFSGVAALLLIIACVNFINLTVSRVFNRAKETGIRKVLGANKSQLIIRFLSESLIFFIISFSLAILLYPFFLKPLEAFMGHRLVITMYDRGLLAFTAAIVIVLSLLTGLYPAWFLSRPQPVSILRNKIVADVKLNFLKKALVTSQFVISVTIVVVTFVVHSQLGFLSRKDLGFDKNNLLNISITSWGTKGQTFKQLIKKLPCIENASISMWYPASGSAGDAYDEIPKPGQKENMIVNYIDGDIDLVPTLKLKILSGRSFNPQFTTDQMNSDSAMNGMSAAVKTQRRIRALLATNYTASQLAVKINNPVARIQGTPVGIVADVYGESLHNKLQPTFIQAISDPQFGVMLIRVKPGFEQQALAGVSKLYKEFYPEKTFQYNWIADQVDAQYHTEYKLQQLFTCFGSLIVFLACLGLFGLISYTTAQRVKEIGIRKVLGASINNIITLISKGYLVLVIIAIAIASPIAFYLMDKWLQDFAYHVNIEWWMFLSAGLIILIIAFATISFHSIKAAIANPVKSLRSE